MQRKFVTIDDVASDAQCSTATVSRALNEPDRVSSKTRSRILESVEKLGYKPNLRASLLAKGSAGGNICFLLSNRRFIHSVHAHMLQGAASRAQAEHIQVLYSTCSYSPDLPSNQIELPKILSVRGIIDGMIVAGTNYANIIPVLESTGLPFVVFGNNFVNTSSKLLKNAVYSNDEGGGYQATKHLIKLGHKKIRYIGDINLPWYIRRFNGYKKAMKEAGLLEFPAVGSFKNDEMQMGITAVETLIANNDEFSALFVAGDIAAVGAIRALKNVGLEVPNDVSIVGYNDEEAAQLSEPMLTTISVPKEEIGAQCVDMLRELIKGDRFKPHAKILNTELIVRDSTQVLL